MMDEIQNTELRHMTSEIKSEQSVVSSDGKVSPLNKGSTGKRRFHHKSKNGCDHCKRRRVKCSMEKPFCHNCLHMNLDCIYSPVQPRKKKAKVTSLKDTDIDTSTTTATTIKNLNLKSGESENEKQNTTSDMSYDGSDQNKNTRNKTTGCDDSNLKLNDSEITAKKVIKRASKTTKNSSTTTNARRSKKKQDSKTVITLDKNKNNKIKEDANTKLRTLKYTVVKPDGTKVTIEEISNSAAIESLKNEFAGQQGHGANAHPHYYQQHDASGLLLPPLMPPGTFQQQQQAPHLLPQLMTLTNSEKFVANEYPLNTLLNSPQSTGMNLTNSIGTFFSLNNAKMLTNLTAKSNTVSTPSSSLATGDGINIKSEKKPVANSSKLLRTPVSASTTLAGSKIMTTPGMFQPAGIGGITYDFHELLGSKLTGSNLEHLNSIIETETDTQSNSDIKLKTKLKIKDPNTNFPSLNSSRSVSSEGFSNENNVDPHVVPEEKRKNSIDNLDSSNLNSSDSSHQQSTLTQIQQEAKDEAAEVLSTMASVAQRDKNNSSVNNYNKRPHKKPLIPQLLEIQSRSGSTGGGNLNLIDLKLFQHYNNVVGDTIVQAGISNHDIWFHEIPNLAFQYPFLMHSLLAFTATHLARTEVGLERIVASHRLDALRLLREAVLHITPENTDALVASSIILIMDSLANAASPVGNNESETKNDAASELSRHLQNVSDRPITEGSMMDPDMIRKAMGAAAASLGTSGANMLNSIPSMVANMAGGAALATNLSTSAWIFHVKGAATILTAVWPLPETSKFYNLINVDLSELGNLLSSPVAMSSSQTGSEHADEMSTGIQYENNDDANERRNGKTSMIQSTITDLVCFDDSIADLYPVEIDSPYLITLAYLDKLNKEKNKDGFILRIFAFPALLDKTFLALLMTGDLNAMRIMRCYYKMLRGFASEYKDKIWFLEGITQVLPVDVDEYSGGGVYMMLDFLGNGLPSMNTTNFDTQQPWTL